MKFLWFFICSFAFADSNLTSDYNATATAISLGMSYTDFNFSMALGGLIVGGFFAYTVLTVTSNFAKGH